MRICCMRLPFIRHAQCRTSGARLGPLLFASDPGAKQETTPARQEAKRSVSTGDSNAGERKFKQNCSRCHTAPEGFSPRISGTILRHMRVRASLSAQDERDILHFLNP